MYRYKPALPESQKRFRTCIAEMMRMVTVVVSLALTGLLYGQKHGKSTALKKKEIGTMIQEINGQLKYYETLSPFSELPDRFELIDSMGTQIVSRLLQVLNDKRIIHYPIDTLFYQNELTITKSDDQRLFFFSLDEKTGGSYRTSKTLIHYRLRDGSVKADYFRGADSEDLITSTYGQIFLLDSLNQKYFALGGVQTCNTCILSLAVLITLDTNTYHTDLIAKHDDRFNDLEVFAFDPLERVFSYAYNPVNTVDEIMDGKEKSEILQQRLMGKFKFINGTFHEIERCEFWEKKEPWDK